MGKLKILPPKPGKTTARGSGAADSNVSDPYTVIHTQHVKYDVTTRQYQGLPAEWEHQLNRQFGIPPHQLETVAVEGRGYGSRVPVVLEQMKKCLVDAGGLTVEGIFRLAPDFSESEFVKQQLNERRFVGCNDPHILANLIKVWFRDLPSPILSSIKLSHLQDCEKSDKAVHTIYHCMDEPQRSYLLWLLDLAVLVSSKQSLNKMTAKNLSIVWGPNLFRAEGDPTTSLQLSQKIVRFLELAILWRAETLPL